MNDTGALRSLEAVYRRESRRVLASLIRLLGGFEPAEEALQEAFAAAAAQWPRDGVPDKPTAWLVSAGRFRAIDRWRRQTRMAGALPDLAALAEPAAEPVMTESVQDDELRLIFTCCHPDLTPDARIALTLREVGGLTTEEIARAYLAPTPTIAQRIVRAKAKIRDEAIPYETPGRADLPVRLESVLQVIYLIFNEGYAATDGPSLTRPDLCAEASRLGRLVAELLDAPEALGLLALMLLHEARRSARIDVDGELVLLEDQDRSAWDRGAIAEAQGLMERVWAARRIGHYGLQAAIAAVHAEAPSAAETDWGRIVTLYDLLNRADPSPVVALNRAAAIAMRDGPALGLAAIEAAIAGGGLDAYALAHAARADMHRRLGHREAARAAYAHALDLTRQGAERRFLERRLGELDPNANPPSER
jgi:RNA polymerase sigma-70 factor (ECF subfamily)